jgi:hypothetical protein
LEKLIRPRLLTQSGGARFVFKQIRRRLRDAIEDGSNFPFFSGAKLFSF